MRQLKISQQITARESKSFTSYLNDVSQIKLLTTEEEVEISNRIKQGDQEALQTLVKANLRFVISVAKQYHTAPGEMLSDLINAGNIGLIIAAQRFDSSRGFKFISYAVWWIRQSIMEHMTNNSKSIRLPANKLSLINKIRNITSKLEQEQERQPTPSEVQEELALIDKKISIVDIEALMASNNSMTSLDSKVNDDGDSSFIDLLVGETDEDLLKNTSYSDLQIVVKMTINKKLTAREKEIIIPLFGLFGTKQKSLDEVGELVGLTRERVRQIREKCLRKLRWQSSTKLMKEYF